MKQVDLPMPVLAPVQDMSWPFIDRNAVLDTGQGLMRLAAPAAPGLGPRQIMAPAIVLGAQDLGLDEAINALMTDAHARLVPRQPSRHLFGRPSHCKTVQHEPAQGWLACHPATPPAPRPGLRARIGRLIADLDAAVPRQLP